MLLILSFSPSTV